MWLGTTGWTLGIPQWLHRAGRSHAAIGHACGRKTETGTCRLKDGEAMGILAELSSVALTALSLPQSLRLPQDPSMKAPFLISFWKLGFCFLSLTDTWLNHLAFDLCLSCLGCLNDLLAWYSSGGYCYSFVKLHPTSRQGYFPLWLCHGDLVGSS